jgi:hypothetical protein
MSPNNPAKISPSKVRWFDGLFGPPDKVLRRWDERRGYDISNSVSNEMEDFDLTEAGTMKLKPGRTQAISGDEFEDSIDTVFPINFTGIRHVGLVAGGSLRVMELAEL